MKYGRLLLVAVIILAAGCASSTPFVTAAEKFIGSVGDEYLEYVNTGVFPDGQAMTPREQGYRIENVKTFRAAVEAEKNVRHNQ